MNLTVVRENFINTYFMFFILFYPPLWGIILIEYSTWKTYKREKYNVPNFLMYFWERNLTYKSYRKSDVM